MEKERLAREQEEKDKVEKAKKMKEQFGDTTGQWEKDKTEMQNIAQQEKKKEAQAAADGEKKVGDDGKEKIVVRADAAEGAKS